MSKTRTDDCARVNQRYFGGETSKSRFTRFVDNNVIKLSFDKTTWTVSYLGLALLILRFRFKHLSMETGNHLKNCVIIQKYDLLAALH